jgi:hypothetical protein
MFQTIIRFRGTVQNLEISPDYPERFGCQVDARTWATAFFRWYNYEHHQRHRSSDARMFISEELKQFWINVKSFARRLSEKPQRFVKGPSIPASVPTAVWTIRPICTHRRNHHRRRRRRVCG